MSKAAKDATQAERIVAALTADTSELRERGLSTLIEFVLDLPVSTFLDPMEISEIITASATAV